MRGKIPWFTPAPKAEDGDAAAVIEGREGRLGEIPKKRKRDDAEDDPVSKPIVNTSIDTKTAEDDDDSEDDQDEFEGFSEDDESESAPRVDAKKASSGDDDDMIPLEELSESDDDSSGGEENG